MRSDKVCQHNLRLFILKESGCLSYVYSAFYEILCCRKTVCNPNPLKLSYMPHEEQEIEIFVNVYITFKNGF